jgi:subtilisin family serine protease
VIDSDALVPDLLVGYVSVTSQGGTSVLDADDLGDPEGYEGSAEDRRSADHAAEASGLEVIAESALGRAVAGPPEAFAELTGGRIVPRERLVHTRAGRKQYVTHFDIVGEGQPEAFGAGVASSRESGIEAVVLERPRFPHAIFPSPKPPPVAAFHLRVPDDVALVLGAQAAQRRGHDGRDVNVAMVDTGHFTHPFFTAHGYDLAPTTAMVPGTDPAKDPVGHGTGESANIFAVAPRATLRPYRASDDKGRLVATLAAFLRAKQDGPHVLTNSWGGDYDEPFPAQPDPADRAIALEIQDAIKKGIVVVFSAGNGHFSVEPQVPGVISAGGVFADRALNLRASDYASGYESKWFGGVKVPLVSGAVGMLPRADYIMLPVQPGCELDTECAVADEEGAPGDGTGPKDGWARFSGTSAAAPQVAGACAAILSANRDLKPEQVAQVLADTAVDVVAGRNHPRFNNMAVAGRDLATGFGLIDVGAATEAAARL